jgi:hypothetical protein
MLRNGSTLPRVGATRKKKYLFNDLAVVNYLNTAEQQTLHFVFASFRNSSKWTYAYGKS